ncbi:hypothetical protein MBLNU230_g5869t1 [Neophaeotheca triangularis]
MQLRRLLTTSAAATSLASAFENASPFFLTTNNGAKTGLELQSANVATASSLRDKVMGALTSEPECAGWEYAVVVHQAGVGGGDFEEESAMPALRERVRESRESVMEVGSVFGALDGEGLVQGLVEGCGGERAVGLQGGFERVVETGHGNKIAQVSYEALPKEQPARAEALVANDAALEKQLSQLPSNAAYVLIYTTTTTTTNLPQDLPEYQYEMDEPYPSALHQDLKRQLHHRADSSDDKDNSTTNPQSNLPLFEKYQFLTPGLFMTLTVSLLLLVILYVGMTALAGLQVSYAAFSKEMGPQAQKPKQG